jgi:energy-coupling factor transporter transmembrane protein EcfT
VYLGKEEFLKAWYEENKILTRFPHTGKIFNTIQTSNSVSLLRRIVNIGVLISVSLIVVWLARYSCLFRWLVTLEIVFFIVVTLFFGGVDSWEILNH